MIKLYGVAFSNLYNAVRLALLEKGFEFELITTFPSQAPEYLEISPMGKIPILQVNEGYLSETTAILEFIEDSNPEIPLFPEDAYSRAKVRELVKVFELYIDNPVRRLLPSLFGNTRASDELLKQVKVDLRRGLGAIRRLASFDPYLVSDGYSYADIYGYFALGLARWITGQVYQWDLAQEVDGLVEWSDRIASNNFVKKIDQEATVALNDLINKNN